MKPFSYYHRYVLCLACAFYALMTACDKSSTSEPEDVTPTNTPQFAVIADIHVYDTNLGTTGQAYQTYLAGDRKLITESEAILESLVDRLKTMALNFVLVAGDLTKDGEKDSHDLVAAYFAELEDAGIEVYVVPGNHDVANPYAFSYDGDIPTPVATVSAEAFAMVYGDYGYDEAMERDDHSLSYLVELNETLWLLALDACRYAENTDYPVTGGLFSDETLTWAKSKLDVAVERGIEVLGMMHHGILEHFGVQNLLFPGYVVEDYQNVATELAAHGLKIMFTGHFHAQDIIKLMTDDGFLFDIETGSTVTSPCPFRTIQITDQNKLTITSHRVQSIEADLSGVSFPVYAQNHLRSGITGIVTAILTDDLMFSQEEAAQLAPILTEAVMAHLAGDESASAEASAGMNALMTDSNLIKQMLGAALSAIWNDPPPKDNAIVIDLTTGAVSDDGAVKPAIFD